MGERVIPPACVAAVRELPMSAHPNDVARAVLDAFVAGGPVAKEERHFGVYPAWVSSLGHAHGAMVLDRGGAVIWDSWTDARDGTAEQQAERSTLRARGVAAVLNYLEAKGE